MSRLEMKLLGGDKLKRVLKTMEAATGKAHELSVGYQNGATFEDGTSVAMVAAIQNFGAPAAKIPARPFFTNMVKQESPAWGEMLGKILREKQWDAETSLNQMGEEVSSKLRDSVRATNSPALSPVTVMLRGMRSNGGPDFVVTGSTVGEAARRVKAGLTNYGARTKPLQDTPEVHLINSVTSVVK